MLSNRNSTFFRKMLKMKSYTYVPSGVVKASGPDAAEFLQGQFSNDLLVEIGRVVYGLWLDRKGKIVADSFVLRVAEDEFLIISYHCPSETIVNRLDAYIIMDDVDLEVIGGCEAMTIWSDDLHAALDRSSFAFPAEGTFLRENGAYLFSGRRGGSKSLELISIGEGARAVDSFVESSDLEPIGEEEVFEMAIQGDKPIWGVGIGASDLPQEVGLGESAVAYNKGCYLGQEVMARIKSMGRVRRQLKPAYVVMEEESASATFGSLAIVDENGGKSGDFRPLVLSSGKCYGFAMAKTGSWGAALFAISKDGETLPLSCL